MTALSTLALKFYRNQSDTNYSAQDIQDALSRIGESFKNTKRSDTSLWNSTKTEMNQDGFINMMSKASGYEGEEAEKDFAILFGMLNTDSTDDTLDTDEITAFAGTDNLTTKQLFYSLVGYDDSIEDILGKYDALIDDPASSLEEEEEESESDSSNVTLSHDEIEEYASKLYKAMDGWGTDEDTVFSIMNNENITDDDWIEIVLTYERMYGSEVGTKSFVHKINDDFSGKDQDELEEKIASSLVKAAENGNEKAVELLASEIYYATAGMAGTCDEFIAGVFANASDELLKEIKDVYSSVNNGNDLLKDIKKDFSGETKKKYLEKLNSL